jgi:uncharacterized membrane protein YoaT (DUF817 family)
MTATATTRTRIGSLRRAAVFARDFVRVQASAVAFAAALFAGIIVTTYVEMPLAQYDILLAYVVALTVGFYLAGWETGREVGVIAAFHVLGLALEIYKVHAGSWTYPGPGVTKVAGVPLYAGFMYAAVGSYICQAWRRMDLRVTGYRPVPLTVLAVALYANFYTHHFWPDARGVLAVLLLLELRRTWVYFSLTGARYRIPLWTSFVLIGAMVWLAENAGTFLGAWRYPSQVDVWQIVHVGKLGSWSLLVSLSFVLVATIKSTEGTRYGDPRTPPSVENATPPREGDQSPG